MKKFFKVNDQIKLYASSVNFAEQLFQLVSSESDLIGRHEWTQRISSVEDALMVLNLQRTANVKGSQLYMYIFFEDLMVGGMYMMDLDERHKRAELGYWLSKEWEGYGIMNESVTAIVKYAFELAGLHRLYVRILASNHRSISLIKRLGFSYEGTFRDEYFSDSGHYENMVQYGMLASDKATI